MTGSAIERRIGAGEETFLRELAHPDPRAVLVIAHGFGEHSDYWSDFASWFQGEFAAAVAAADFPGHGRSEGERMVYRDFADLVEVIDLVVEDQRARHPGLPIVLLGHSMGGLAAARYAQAHGEKLAGLVLHAAASIPPELLALEGLELTLEQMTPDPALQRVILEDPFRVEGPPPPATRSAATAAAAASMTAEPLGPLPVVWLHGQADLLVSPAGARTGFARLGADRGALLTYPGVGHGGILEAGSPQMRTDLAAALRMLLPGLGT